MSAAVAPGGAEGASGDELLSSARRTITDGGDLRLAIVGVSAHAICGARDHARLLAGALEDGPASCSMHWLERRQTAPRAALAEIRGWAAALGTELDERQPDAIVLHYSAFSYAYRGIPLFARPILAAAQRPRTPLVTILHEYAYPWRTRDPRGNVWALTQRAALIDLLRSSSAAVVTAAFRVAWLASRPWLPKRPIAVAPVFSNLPAPAPNAAPQRSGLLVGLFGYAYESASMTLVLDAVALSITRGLPVHLRLLGSPGRESPAGEQWRAAAEARGIAAALSFGGIMPAQELSDALASCNVLAFADAPGPTSRKGTLAASLASGTPVIAADGPHTWPELVRAEAARVVEPKAGALADGLAEVLRDDTRAASLGARGREFAAAQMSVAHSADVVRALVEDLRGARPPGRR